jgi:uncharacterized protein involved in exopolysaccharide biosynthesis
VSDRSAPVWPDPGESVGPYSPTGFVAALWRGWPLLVVALVVALALGLLSLWLVPPLHVATSMFRPEVSERQLPLSGFAAQLGIARGTLGSESVDFYARLLRSADLLRDAAGQTYAAAPGQPDEPLYAVWGAGSSESERIKHAARELDRRLRVRSDWDAGLIVVETLAEDAVLAEQINRRLLDLVDDFNIRRRMNRGAQERQFVEARLEEAKATLDSAETELERFLQRNRTYRSSPQLVLESERLGRRVQLQQQVFANLSQSLEEARIEEVRNTAIISVVQNPEGTARRQGRALRLVLFLTIGLFVGVSAALMREVHQHARRAGIGRR